MLNGEPCPVSGLWETVGNPRTTRLICKGELMPDYMGKAVQWQLIKRDDKNINDKAAVAPPEENDGSPHKQEH